VIRIDIPIVGDVGHVLEDLLKVWKSRGRKTNSEGLAKWWSKIEEWRAKDCLKFTQSGKVIKPQHALSRLEALTKDHDRYITTEVGQHQMWAAQFLSFNHANTFVSSGGLGAMGFELPAALGAQVGKPGAPVWSVAGDGGFQMTLQELVTLSEEKLPVKIALINNGYLGMVRQWQEMYFDNHLKAVPVSGPDFIKLAEAYGVGAVRVTEYEDVLPALRQAQAHDGPFLIEFVVDSTTNVYPMVPPGGSLADTIEDPAMVSNPVT